MGARPPRASSVRVKVRSPTVRRPTRWKSVKPKTVVSSFSTKLTVAACEGVGLAVSPEHGLADAEMARDLVARRGP
jgi:hypothetical protein